MNDSTNTNPAPDGGLPPRPTDASTALRAAMDHAPDVLLRLLDQSELDHLTRATDELLRRLHDDGHHVAAAYLRAAVNFPVNDRAVDVFDGLFEVRVQLANGHVAMLAHDRVMGERHGTPWGYTCSCEGGNHSRNYETRELAVEAGRVHVEAHGGEWASDLEDQP